MKNVIITKLLFLVIGISCSNPQDPFSLLGIPSLNPSQIFSEELPQTMNYKSSPMKTTTLNDYPTSPSLKSIEDLPSFLQSSRLSEADGIEVISKFIIADDYLLKSYGAVFDQSGFDGLIKIEQIFPKGNQQRSVQRAKSAGKIYFQANYEDNGYESYGAEEVKGIKLNGWKIYKVLLVGKINVNDHIFLRVCLPDDEMLAPLVTKITEDCSSKIKYVEEAKLKNAPYLTKIMTSHFFKTSVPSILKSIPIQTENSKLSNLKNNIASFVNVNIKQNQATEQGVVNPPMLKNSTQQNKQGVMNPSLNQFLSTPPNQFTSQGAVEHHVLTKLTQPNTTFKFMQNANINPNTIPLLL